jgi:GNAT superfamily N-acetyltransferase
MSFEIKTYTASQLLEFINSEEFNHLENYPITRHRALSHINNPRGNETDKILYLALENGEIVGYRLLMVDTIIIDDKPEKIGWYSCVWVHPNKRGSGIAKKMVEISLSDWNNNIIFQGPVSASKNLYVSTNVFNEVFITGLRAYTRFDFNEVLSAKLPRLKPLSFVFITIDAFLNLFIDAFSGSKQNINKNKHIQFVKEIDDEIEHFIKKHQQHNLFKRTKTELNWILNYPWILNSDTIDNVSANYHFSSIAKRFEFFNVKFFDNENQLAGFVMLQLLNKHLTVHTAYFESSQTKVIVELIYQLIKENKINSFSVYNKELVDYMSSNQNPFIFKKSLKRGFYYSKNFEHYFKKNPQLRFEAGDGDMIFT